MEPISSILGTDNLVQAVQSSYQAISHLSARGLPSAFALVADDLTLVKKTLDVAGDALHHKSLSANVSAEINEWLSACWQSSQALQGVFVDIAAEDGKCPASAEGAPSARDFYLTVLRSRGAAAKAHRVEVLMSEVLRNIQRMISIDVFVNATRDNAVGIQSAIDALNGGEASATDSELETS